MKKYFVYFFLLFTCVSLSCFATEYASDEISETSIQKIDEHKVYLKPGTVQIAKNGIFIHIDGELLPISHLETDSNGVYFEPQRMEIESCKTCGVPLLWGKCPNPVCPSKDKKKKKK